MVRGRSATATAENGWAMAGTGRERGVEGAIGNRDRGMELSAESVACGFRQAQVEHAETVHLRSPRRAFQEDVGQAFRAPAATVTAGRPAVRPECGLPPFGQIPTYEEPDLTLFESGAIVFHIAERHAGLLP